nr:manganese catalase family protein [Desulfuribacillus stibiiarsenatis]
MQAKGEPIADLTEDIAAEEKARVTYENLIKLTDDRGVIDALSFLREREVVHSQRFREALYIVEEHYKQNPHDQNQFCQPIRGSEIFTTSANINPEDILR